MPSWEDGTPALTIPQGFKGAAALQRGLSLGAPAAPHMQSDVRMRDQHGLSTWRRDEVPSMDGPSADTEGRYQGTPGATSQLQPSVLPGLRVPMADQAKPLPGTESGQGAGQVTTRHLCQAAGHPGPRHTLSSWSSGAGGLCAAPGTAAEPPRAAGGPRVLCQDHAGAGGLCKPAAAGSAVQQEY